MTITIAFEARCSFCPALYQIGKINVTLVNMTKHQFIKQLRISGWAVGKYITCPDCTEVGRPKKKTLDEWTTETQARLNKHGEI